MYLSFYNLRVKPFQMSTDPEFLWLGEKHKEALAVLKYAIMENKGVLALTGDVGTGKTTLINALLKSLGKDTITATIYDARLDVLDFFNTVAAAFKIKGTFEGKGQFILKFMEFLIQTHERNQKVLLIIDEAQGINTGLLEEIRLLSNLEAEYTRLLNIFFVGQNEFIDILQKYENRALRQRVTIRYHIDPLTLNETAAYIQHRLKVSGTTAPIFDSGAIDEIYFFSGGYPRLINIMCDHALLTGYVREVRTINANHIRECREELLVSKKSSGEDFEFPAGNHQVLSSEPMTSEAYGEPMASDISGEPIASDPSTESAASDLSKELMDYVNDSRPTEDEQYRFGPQFWTYERESSKKSKRKRFFSFFSILIFLLVAGAGYFLYGKTRNKPASLVATTQQPSKKHFSIKMKSKNDDSITTKARPDASDNPEKVQSEKSEGSRLSVNDSSNSDISRTDVPQKNESVQPVPLKTFSQAAGTASFAKKPKNPLDAEVSKETAGITSSDTSRPDLNPKTKAANLKSEKTGKEIQVPDQTPEKLPLIPEKLPQKPFAVAKSSTNLPVKDSLPIPTTTSTNDDVQTTLSEPAQVHATAKNAKSAKKTLLNPVKKTEAADSIAQPVREQNKTKAPKKELAAASPVTSDKKTDALFKKFKKNLSKKRAVSENVKSVKQSALIKEKTPSAFSVADQKKPINQKAKNQADQGAKERITSLGVGTNTVEKTKKTHLTYIPLTTRLETFLKKYCQTYEQKDIDKFSDLFAFNAVEKGKPFKSWFPTYRRNFKRIDSIEYNIELKRYATQEETGLVKIDGTFHVRAKLEGSKEWLKNSGDISMILETDGNSFKVKQLEY